ncbi:PadR family transcriptional regulator [Promethearchaeum syntrophicum]|uniref:PadR family transcriptional regulator n=1 Tax=Promethearchaeum syntrophicum TaxID=2594042 RepID=A0A5B9D8F4_9ARCH|nr:PadR family transcriptional regulator [Candidatus Prometheoarchaeum syntrophicum]QEE15040.1 Transcriptional regulator PadR-like family protein [Candidatus Prometheoarchaeum syntrophicum]
MFSKKIRLDSKSRNKTVSVATTLVLMAIAELEDDPLNKARVVYGYQIMQHLQNKYSWNVKSGTVYPILKKLKQDNLIVMQTNMQKDSNRQQIFYKINKFGRKLIDEIISLNPEALDMALKEGNIHDDTQVKEISKIPKKNFTTQYLAPILIHFEDKISKMVSLDTPKDELETLQKEIEKSIEQIEACNILLKSHITRIVNYMDLQSNE